MLIYNCYDLYKLVNFSYAELLSETCYNFICSNIFALKIKIYINTVLLIKLYFRFFLLYLELLSFFLSILLPTEKTNLSILLYISNLHQDYILITCS